jgi:tetratricopeptide (TPR) repeat protein
MADISKTDAELLAEADLSLRLDDLGRAEALYDGVLRTTADPLARAGALAGLGQLAFRRGNPNGAIDALEQSLALEADAPPGMLETLGRAYATASRSAEAARPFELGLAAARARGDAAATTRFALLLANAFVDAAQIGRAQEVLGGALVGIDEADPHVQADLVWTQARLHSLTGNQDAAARYARQTIGLLERAEDPYRLGRACHMAAYIEIERGDHAEALDLVRRALELVRDDASPLEQARYRIEEARALASLGEREEAAAVAMAACSVLAESEPHDAARGYLVIGDAFRAGGDSARAHELYELCLELLESEPNMWLPEAFARISELLEAEGRTDEALAMLKRAVEARPTARRPQPPPD